MGVVLCNESLPAAVVSAEIAPDYPNRDYFSVVFQQGKPTVKLARDRTWDFVAPDLDVPILTRRCNGSVGRTFVKFQGPQPPPLPAAVAVKPFGPSVPLASTTADNNNSILATTTTNGHGDDGGLSAWWWLPDGPTRFVLLGVAALLVFLLFVFLLWAVRRRRRSLANPPSAVFSSPIRIADPENAIRQLPTGHGFYAAVASPADFADYEGWDRSSDEPLLVPCTYDELKVFGDEGGHSQLSLSVASDKN